MIKFLCKKDCYGFPQTKKGKVYYGIYDKDENILLIDDWYIKQNVNKENFKSNRHGVLVENKNKKYFEVIQ